MGLARDAGMLEGGGGLEVPAAPIAGDTLCIYMCVCVCAFTFAYLIYACESVFVRVSCVCVCLCVFVCVRMCWCLCVHVCVCMYVLHGSVCVWVCRIFCTF